MRASGGLHLRVMKKTPQISHEKLQEVHLWHTDYILYILHSVSDNTIQATVFFIMCKQDLTIRFK